MPNGSGKKRGRNGGTTDLTVEILKQIRDNTEITNTRLAALEAKVETGFAELRGTIVVLVEGQHDLARNVTQLNVGMTRVLDEVRDLRDEKYRRLEDRLARLEERAGHD